MGILGSIFGKAGAKEQREEGGLPWIALENLDQLDEIAEKSHQRTQLIFKHSTSCGISRMVLGVFSKNYDAQDVDAYFLDLHAHRNISNEIADKFGVVHESPQLLIFKNGAVHFHTSHGAIADLDLQKVL